MKLYIVTVWATEAEKRGRKMWCIYIKINICGEVVIDHGYKVKMKWAEEEVVRRVMAEMG